MEYSITELANLAGVSVRTLHYYDQIGLLSPDRKANNYRSYGPNEVDLLQQILFYRELDVPLAQIKKILDARNYDAVHALQGHLKALEEKRTKIDRLIGTLRKSIDVMKGNGNMSDKEKFEGFKKNMLDENEKKFGKEVREMFGSEAVNESNKRLMGMSESQYERVQELSRQINELLLKAFKDGDPSSLLAQEVCVLHREWLGFYWKNYTREAHLAMAQSYVDDPRFKAYYDLLAEGCAVFLRDAIAVYCRDPQ